MTTCLYAPPAEVPDTVALHAGSGPRTPGLLDEAGGRALQHYPSDIAAGDLNDIVSAVTARLRITAGERPGPQTESDLHGTLARMRGNLLDCARTLDQIQVSLGHEIARRQQLELELFDGRTALAQARAELRGTQAGERHALHLAQHDSLTALPNRSFFGERLEHALALAAPRRRALAVMYLDLDGFKPINDTHGHAAGDELLRVVAARLARTVRAEDMVSRLGGDEFGCLIAGAPSREQLGQLACKLMDAVAAHCKIGPLRLRIRPSIGIAICPEDGTTAEALLKNADAAMYFAKRQRTGHAFSDQVVDP